MKRSSKSELAQRINRAFLLLEQQVASQQVIQIVSKEFSVSEIQAYRYVQQAKKNTALLPVPESTKIFTTNLADHLIDRIKLVSKSKELPINQVVSQALEDYLNQQGYGQEKEEQASGTPL